jgi:hypothetical protein
MCSGWRFNLRAGLGRGGLTCDPPKQLSRTAVCTSPPLPFHPPWRGPVFLPSFPSPSDGLPSTKTFFRCAPPPSPPRAPLPPAPPRRPAHPAPAHPAACARGAPTSPPLRKTGRGERRVVVVRGRNDSRPVPFRRRVRVSASPALFSRACGARGGGEGRCGHGPGRRRAGGAGEARDAAHTYAAENSR